LLELKHEYSQSHVGFVSCTYKFTTNKNWFTCHIILVTITRFIQFLRGGPN
jgi:hypothetical protein